MRTVRGYLLRHSTPQVPDECELVYETLQAGSVPGVMVDVGAHVGTSLVPFAEVGWRVLALEPDSTNRRRLESEVSRFPLITIDARAASDHHEEGVSFYRSDVSSGISGLQAFDASHHESDRVTLAPLAQIISDHEIDRIDFLKVDTEGFDLFVLRGLPFESHAPRAIVVEFEDSKSIPLGYTWNDMARYLTDRGYFVLVSEWKPIVRYGVAHEWSRFGEYPTALSTPKAWGNLIAVRGDNLRLALLAAAGRFEERRRMVRQ